MFLIRTMCCALCAAKLKRRNCHSEEKSCFTSGGFINWRKATSKFSQRDCSDLHLESVRMLASLNQKPISAMISENVGKYQKVARTALELLFRSIRLLAREGVPLWGHNHWDGVLWQMILDRTYDKSKAHEWIQWRDNWISGTIQNKIFKILTHR